MQLYPITLNYCVGYGVQPGRDFVGPLYQPYRFLVRTLTRQEHANWGLQHPVFHEFQTRLLKETVVSHPEQFLGQPWDWEEVYSGVVERLVDQILQLSGFSDTASELIAGRVQEYIESPQSKFDLLIMTAFNVTLQDLLNMHPEEWHKTLALSQLKLSVVGFNTDLILNPEGVPTQRPTAPMPNQRQGVQSVADGMLAIHSSPGSKAQAVVEAGSMNFSDGKVLDFNFGKMAED